MTEDFRDLQPSPIEQVLGLQAGAANAGMDRPVLLVSRVIRSKEFLCGARMGVWPIAELLPCGKLDRDGRTIELTPNRPTGHPCVVISQDMWRVQEAIETNGLSPSVIIAETPEVLAVDVDPLDCALEAGLPVCAVADVTTAHYLALLMDGHPFRVWSWTRQLSNTLPNCNRAWDRSAFGHVHRSLAATGTTLKEVPVRNDELDAVVRDVERLRFHFRDRGDREQQLYDLMWHTATDMSCLVHRPSDTWRATRIARLDQGVQLLSGNPWLSDDAKEEARRVIDKLEVMVRSTADREPAKAHAAKEVLAACNWRAHVVMRTQQDAEEASGYWSDGLAGHRKADVRFEATEDLTDETDGSSPLLVAGWMGKASMRNLCLDKRAHGVQVLLHRFESQWLKRARRSWRRAAFFPLHLTDFNDILPEIRQAGIPSSGETDEATVDINPEDDFDIEEMELHLARTRYGSYVKSTGTTVKALPVEFCGGRLAFLSEDRRQIVVTSLLAGDVDARAIPKPADQLRVGDYILFAESDKDLIREIADNSLIKSGQGHLRGSAMLWRKALQELYKDFSHDVSRLQDRLTQAGCSRTLATLRFWLTDEAEPIGPRILNDVDVIARVTRNRALGGHLGDVKNAIHDVRGAHLQAASFLSERLRHKLPQYLRGQAAPAGTLELTLEEFGKVRIARVAGTADEFLDVEPSSANRLLDNDRGDDTRQTGLF